MLSPLCNHHPNSTTRRKKQLRYLASREAPVNAKAQTTEYLGRTSASIGALSRTIGRKSTKPEQIAPCEVT